MWLEHEKFREIDHAVVKGERRGLSRLLSELFHPENQKYGKKLTVCPKCQKPLVRKMHPYLEYFVNACPDWHGVWMSPEVSAKLKQFVSEQMHLATKKKQAVQLLISAVAGLVLISLLGYVPSLLPRLTVNSQESKIGQDYWPQRNFSAFVPDTITETSIQDPNERNYFLQMLPLLEQGASNRMNIEAVLKDPKSKDEYWEAFEVYQQRQNALLSKLRMIPVPEPLQGFHQHLEVVAQAHLEFYAHFIQEKIKDRSTTFFEMQDHPALKISSRELESAFALILERYPDMDSQSRLAIESRLSWFSAV